MIIELSDTQSARLWQVGPNGRVLMLRVGDRFAQVHSFDEWLDGLQFFDGEAWQEARLLVTLVAVGTHYSTRSESLEAGSVPMARVTVAGGYHEFDLRELRLWPSRWMGSVHSAADSARALEFGSPCGGDDLIPALPPGWYAYRKLSESSWTSWNAQSTTYQPSMVIDVLSLESAASERVLSDLLKIAASPHPGLAPIEHIWRFPGGLMVQGAENAHSLTDALAGGDLDGEALIRACYDAARAIDHLERIGVTAHRNIEPGHLAWSTSGSRALCAAYPDRVELGAVEAASGFLAPERVRGDPASSRSDQFALAISYIIARTGNNPLIPNELAVLSGQRPVPLQGLYPAETAVLRRALDADPRQRWPDARSFILALADTQSVPRERLDSEAGQSGSFSASPAHVSGGTPKAPRLDAYRRLFRETPPPTADQINAFVEHVASKHSWYKHLPMTPPGVRFIVYLDPGAGMQHYRLNDGTSGFRDIGPDDTLFHHAMKPTSEYRRLFGHLNVLDQGAPSFALYSDAGEVQFDTGPGILIDGEIKPIPEEIAFSGSVLVTAMLHERSGEYWLWERHFEDSEHEPSRWPAESGGPVIVDAIRCLWREQKSLHHYQSVIEQLVKPERDRQRALLRRQIERMLALVYD